MNILILTLGASWPVVPEILGFTNPDLYPFYREHSQKARIDTLRRQYMIEPVDECWIITTNGKQVTSGIDQLKKWALNLEPALRFAFYSFSQIREFNNVSEVDFFRELVCRVVLKASAASAGGKKYFSLAGGRKTMSTDILQAAEIFGSDAIIHLMDNGAIPLTYQHPNAELLVDIPPAEVANCFSPLIVSGKRIPHPLTLIEPKICSRDFPVNESLNEAGEVKLSGIIQNRLEQSGNLMINAYRQRTGTDSQSSFLALQLLPLDKINDLQSYRVGKEMKTKEADLLWLKMLPKPELHCHLGGVLDPDEMLRVALANESEIEITIERNPVYAKWLKDTQQLVDDENYHLLIESFDGREKQIRNYIHGVKEPLCDAGFLYTFRNHPERLKRFIYRDFEIGKEQFRGIGFERYERLGDLQGSGLLKNEVSLREICRILREKCIKDHISYMELRCSPLNYASPSFSPERVYQVLAEELSGLDTMFRLLLIVSRHRGMQKIKEAVEFALNLKQLQGFPIAGIDVAGNERISSPSKLRETFIPLLEHCLPITIHAGEGEEVQSIWEAVYHLNADRIGHGLSLNEQPDLIIRFRDRKIAIEMCPSSNDQIIGFKDFLDGDTQDYERPYPLRCFLDAGLKVTINTDDPGISCTTLSQEYFKAASMTPDGLSKWEILQILRNGYQAAFLPYDQKKLLINNIERELVGIL